MQKVDLIKDKVSIHLGEGVIKRLQNQIEQIVNDWGEYQKPKVKVFEEGQFALELDKAICSRINSLVKTAKCRLCGRKIEGKHCIISQIQTNEYNKKLLAHYICGSCYDWLELLIRFIKGDIKERFILFKKAGKKVVVKRR